MSDWREQILEGWDDEDQSRYERMLERLKMHKFFEAKRYICFNCDYTADSPILDCPWCGGPIEDLEPATK